MRPLSEFHNREITVLFTDIDGTLTSQGRLSAASYAALEELQQSGIQVVPVTGRPAGWCDLIARYWPVHGVVGENGGLIYRYDGHQMRRHYLVDRDTRRRHRRQLKAIAADVRAEVPKAKIAADQFCRLFDLAIDFAEDLAPLPMSDALQIKSIFERHGAHAKVSNIHVNGWFGDYDKLTTCELYCQEFLGFSLREHQDRCLFVGDSANDEPMFAHFKWSAAVANVVDFLPQMKAHPAFVSPSREGQGFIEIARRVLATRRAPL